MSSSVKNSSVDAFQKLTWPRSLSTPGQLIEALSLKTKLCFVKSPICSKLVLQVIGSSAYLLANILNKTQVFNYNTFKRELDNVEKIHLQPKDLSIKTGSQNSDSQAKTGVKINAPLFTLSNHISCIDDPILWGALLPFSYYHSKTDCVRWAAGANDVCFLRPWHATFFSLGKTFPVIRGAGLNQPAMDFATALLLHNMWLHMFPEGRVMRDNNGNRLSNADRGYKFKWGAAKLILDYLKCDTATLDRSSTSACKSREIRILPMYHLGLDDILPIGWPYIPRINKRITIFIRQNTIAMNVRLLSKILRTRQLNACQKYRTADEINRIKLTNYLEEEVEKLEDIATNLHKSN